MTPCPCGRPNCWHVNIQAYCAQQAETNRLVSVIFAAVTMAVIIGLIRPRRHL